MCTYSRSFNYVSRTGKGIPLHWLSYISVVLFTISVTTSGESKVKFEPSFEPGNSLGIFTERIMVMQKWAEGTKLLKEMNRKYVDDDGLAAIQEACEKNQYAKMSDEPGDEVQFGNCSFTADTVAVYEFTGLPEIYSYNYTTKQVRIQKFTPTYDDNIRCVVDKLRRPRFYAAVMSFLFSGDFSKPIHKLDSILEHQMAFFEDTIEPELVYQFHPVLDFINRPPQYECIISVMTSGTVEEIEKNCKISCAKKKDGTPVDYKKFRDEL